MTPALTVRLFFFFLLPLVPPGLCIDLPISTRLWKEEAHSLIPMWPFRRMIFCYSLRVVTRLGCQYSCLATARFWIIACLHHWGARAQQVESAGQCTSRRKCLKRFLWCSSQFGGESGVIASGYWDRVSVLFVINRIALWREGLL